MAILGRRQPFKPIIKSALLTPQPPIGKVVRARGELASQTAALALLRQYPLHPIIRGLIKASAPVVAPVAAKPLIVGQKTTQAAAAVYYRLPNPVILKGRIRFAVAAAPAAAKPVIRGAFAARAATELYFRLPFPVHVRPFPAGGAAAGDVANATDVCDAFISPRPRHRLNPDPRASQRSRHFMQRLARTKWFEVEGTACGTVCEADTFVFTGSGSLSTAAEYSNGTATAPIIYDGTGDLVLGVITDAGTGSLGVTVSACPGPVSTRLRIALSVSAGVLGSCALLDGNTYDIDWSTGSTWTDGVYWTLISIAGTWSINSPVIGGCSFPAPGAPSGACSPFLFTFVYVVGAGTITATITEVP